MPPPQFSRRRRRWVHTVATTPMRCFTDDEIARGLRAVLEDCGPNGINAVRSPSERVTPDTLLPIFLKAAQPTAGATDDDWPTRHPMHCRGCGRALTDRAGTALVNISIVERQWRCDHCASG